MFRLAKYLKPFSALVGISIALLFVQAVADLSLPDYMSRIVNIGIQQGGVDHAVPKAIRQSEMDKLMLFMSTDEQADVLEHYTLVNADSVDYDTYIGDYPVLADQPIYVLKDVDEAVIDRISPVMAKALVVVSGIEQAIADPEAASRMGEG